MSYILDALKKSEDEREREKGMVPDIQSIHSGFNGSVENEQNIWPYAIGIAVVVLLVGVFIIWQTVFKTDDSELDASVLAQLNQPSSAVQAGSAKTTPSATATTKSKPSQTKPVAKPAKPKKTVKPKSTAKNTSKPKSSQRVVFAKEPLDITGDKVSSKQSLVSEKVFNVAELPLSVRKNVPSITFSGHVYSSTPANRSVMINGKKMREKQSVTSNLLLNEITPEGAVFRYNGYLFSLGSLQDWSFKQ